MRRGAHRAADDGRGRGYVHRLHHGFAWGTLKAQQQNYAAAGVHRRLSSSPPLAPSRINIIIIPFLPTVRATCIGVVVFEV